MYHVNDHIKVCHTISAIEQLCSLSNFLNLQFAIPVKINNSQHWFIKEDGETLITYLKPDNLPIVGNVDEVLTAFYQEII